MAWRRSPGTSVGLAAARGVRAVALVAIVAIVAVSLSVVDGALGLGLPGSSWLRSDVLYAPLEP
jgi:hypothetical protein